MIRIAKEWNCSYAIMHFNRGCEGTSIGLPENRAALVNAGILTLTFEAIWQPPERSMRVQYCAKWTFFCVPTGMRHWRIDIVHPKLVILDFIMEVFCYEAY